MALNQQNIHLSESDRVTLTNKIFEAFPKTVSGLTFYILDFGCVYSRRKFVGGDLDREVGIYRDAEGGLCEA